MNRFDWSVMHRTFVLVFAVLSMTASCRARVDIAENGAAKAVIFIDRNASPADQHAANELAAFLGKVTGGSFSISNNPSADGSQIAIGQAAARMIDPSFSADGLGSEGIVIRTHGNDLILAGGEPRGTLYAVYTLLEDEVGCHWWTPDDSTIPWRPTLSIDNIDKRYIPTFEYRETNDPAALDGDWSVRNKFNGPYHNLTAEQGSKHAYIGINKWYNAGSFWTLIPPEVYFQSHPEWFSLINGKRSVAPNHSTLCLTNEEMRKELVKNQLLALAWLNRPDVDMVSISQIDDGGYPVTCQCDQCVAVEKEEGAPSGLMIRFVNSVAEDLEKSYPNLTITTLAYHYTQKPPLHVKPRHNVVVQLCDIHCSFAVPLYDERNNDFQSDLQGWTKICNRLYFWDYVGNYRCTLQPHPYFRVLGLNTKYLAQIGIKGIFGESPDSEVPGVDPYSPLRNWVLGKLYWDPDSDVQALMRQFCDGYYGAGGDEVLAYLNLLDDSVAHSGDKLGIGSEADAKFLSFDAMSKGWAHLQAAEQAAGTDPKVLQRIQLMKLSVVYVFLYDRDRLQAQAKAENAAWPMSDSISEVAKQFKKAALENGLAVTDIPLPEDAMKAMQ
jgi:hypothetical protein